MRSYFVVVVVLLLLLLLLVLLLLLLILLLVLPSASSKRGYMEKYPQLERDTHADGGAAVYTPPGPFQQKPECRNAILLCDVGSLRSFRRNANDGTDPMATSSPCSYLFHLLESTVTPVGGGGRCTRVRFFPSRGVDPDLRCFRNDHGKPNRAPI